MFAKVGWLRRQLSGIAALALIVTMFFTARLPTSSAAEIEGLASKYSFKSMSIALPGGYPQQSIRKVNQTYKHIDAWISSVGAAIAMNDLDGDGLANDLCLVDPRIDQVVVTPAPGGREDRYAPFALDPNGLPMNQAMAPMGCVPGDFNEDGRLDMLVYLWGRTPILYLARPGATKLTADAYLATELIPEPNSSNGIYTGEQWNSNTATVADFDGDGHDDLYIGNYFPPGPVLDDTVSGGVVLNRSFSHATNGGKDYLFRWTGATTGLWPAVSYQVVTDALPAGTDTGWDLGVGANDLDGDLLPELYVANDHGPDRMLHNRSTPGNIKFALVEGVRHALVPKSKRIGVDSFKGMGVDFGDLNSDGIYDMFISNITTSFGLEESQLAYVSTAKDKADLRTHLQQGVAPWEDRSTQLGLNWTGWGWDAKLADFDNSGRLVVAQTTGFVKGKVNRWPQLQELATGNDMLLEHPGIWPHIREGDDIAGNQAFAFLVKNGDGRYVDVAGQLGLAVPVPTRGVATGDADGDGRLDFAVARQWDAPIFYHNDSPSPGAFLGLRLTHDTQPTADELAAPGSPVVGAQVTVTTPGGGRFLGRVDGGSGHSGKRSQEVHIGLGDVAGPVQVHLSWRDRRGQVREQDLQLAPGWHLLQLGSKATER